MQSDWIAADSARQYIDRLEWIRTKPRISSDLQTTVDSLVSALTEALRLRKDLKPTNISFNAGRVAALVDDEKFNLINPYCVGFGDEMAPVIVMGTEEASTPQDLAITNCAGALLRLCESNRAVLEALYEGHAHDPRSSPKWFSIGIEARRHLQPMDFVRATQTLRRGGTWATIGDVLGCSMGDIGYRAYLIERSAVPSTLASRGVPPEPDRRNWLARILDGTRDTARVLIIHGRVGVACEPDPASEWDRANRALTAAFLGCEVIEPAIQPPVHKHVAIFRLDRRVVLWTGALSGRNRQLNDASLIPTIGGVVREALL